MYHLHIWLERHRNGCHHSWVINYCHPSAIQICQGHDVEKDKPIFTYLDELIGEEPSHTDINHILREQLGCTIRIIGDEDRATDEGELVRYEILGEINEDS